MDSRELVKSALNHQDGHGRCPSAIHLAGDAIEAYRDKLYDRYKTGTSETLLNAGILNRYDALKIAMGNDIFTCYAPWWDWYDLPEAYYTDYDAPSYLPKTIGSGPSYENMIGLMKAVKEETGKYILVTLWGSHFEKAYFARGIENFLADMAGDPDFAQRLLDTIIRKNIVMLENIVNIPYIDGILLGSDWGSQRSLLMSPESWRRMIAGGEKQEYDLIHSAGKDVFVHSCGCIDAIIPDLVSMGLDALNPVQPECMDIARLKADYGDRLTFWGGISTQHILPYGTPDEVADETRKTISLMSKNGGYITSPSQDIQADVPFENICAIIETANEYK